MKDLTKDLNAEELGKGLEELGFEKPSCLNCKFHISRSFPDRPGCSALEGRRRELDPDTLKKLDRREKVEDPGVKFHVYAKANGLDAWPQSFDLHWLESCRYYERKSDGEGTNHDQV